MEDNIFDDLDSLLIHIAVLKSNCYDQIDELTKQYNGKVNELKNNLNKEISNLQATNAHLFDDYEVKGKRKTIPKAIRNKCWDINVGKEKGVALCPVCQKNEIDSKHFEVGHIVSVKNGGDDNVSNLKPICEECNKYMGSKNMNEYMAEITALLK
jgi:5-methylcytosine-specific restriction endonuclease McrA